jgi:hypothetical protein
MSTAKLAAAKAISKGASRMRRSDDFMPRPLSWSGGEKDSLSG